MLHHRVATCHAARAHSRQAVAVRAIMQGAPTQVSVRAAREQAGLWPAGSWLRPGRWCRLLTATSPACRRCQCCSCCGCRCMSACARQHCCGLSERARTMRAWAAQMLHPTGPRGCRNHLAGSPPCRAEPGWPQQTAKSSFRTFCPPLYRSTVRVSQQDRRPAAVRTSNVALFGHRRPPRWHHG